MLLQDQLARYLNGWRMADVILIVTATDYDAVLFHLVISYRGTTFAVCHFFERYISIFLRPIQRQFPHMNKFERFLQNYLYF